MSVNPLAEKALDAVQSELEKNESRPIDLLKALRNQGHADSDIKQAISQLLSDGIVELTSERILKIAVRDAAKTTADSAA